MASHSGIIHVAVLHISADSMLFYSSIIIHNIFIISKKYYILIFVHVTIFNKFL
jgi:hypothetical protein